MNTPRGLKVIFKGRTLQEFAQRYLTDLSASGMFVRTKEPLPVGTQLRFDFRLEDNTPLLRGAAIVLWMAEESPELNLPSGMELRFDSFDDESEKRFQWLQLERRGVTVGREIPLEITSSTAESLDEVPTDEYDLRKDSWTQAPVPDENIAQDLPTKKLAELIEEEASRIEPGPGDPWEAPAPPASDLAQEDAEQLAAALGAPSTLDGEYGSSGDRYPVEASEGFPLDSVKTTLLYGSRRRPWIFIAALLLFAVVVGGGVALLRPQSKAPASASTNAPLEQKPQRVTLRADAGAKATVASPSPEPAHKRTAPDNRSTSVNTPDAARAPRAIAHAAPSKSGSARPGTVMPRPRQRNPQRPVTRKRSGAKDARKRTIDSAVSKALAPVSAPKADDTLNEDIKEPAEQVPTPDMPKEKVVGKDEPAGKDEPGAPVGAPPDQKIKVPTWVDTQQKKNQLKKPTWLEQSEPTR